MLLYLIDLDILMAHISLGYPDPVIASLNRIPAGGGLSGYLVNAGTVSGKEALDTFDGLRLKAN